MSCFLESDFQHEAHTGATHIFPVVFQRTQRHEVYTEIKETGDTRTKNTRWTAAREGGGEGGRR